MVAEQCCHADRDAVCPVRRVCFTQTFTLTVTERFKRFGSPAGLTKGSKGSVQSSLHGCGRSVTTFHSYQRRIPSLHCNITVTYIVTSASLQRPTAHGLSIHGILHCNSTQIIITDLFQLECSHLTCGPPSVTVACFCLQTKVTVLPHFYSADNI